MPQFFITKRNNLPDFFKTISADDIQGCCESKVYHRGLEYFKYGCVADASYNIDKTRLKTLVKGNSEYTVIIDLQNGNVEGSCTCPYGGTCKHVIASLLFAIDENSEIEVLPNAKNPETDINQYLQSLSKNELIGLVKKFAPEQFWVEVKNTFSDSSSAQTTFRKVERNIQKIFKDSDCLDNPEDFDAALDKEIKKLSGLEKHLKSEVEGLLLYIIGEVDKAFDEGYLYDHYNDYNYEPSEEFIGFASNFVKSLNYEEKTAFLTKLDTVLKEQSYNIFGSLQQLYETVFTEDDLPALKEMLVSGYKKMSHNLIENYYEQVRILLTEQEKEVILTEIQNNSSKWIIELASLYDSWNQEIKAIDAIKVWLTENNGFGIDEVYTLYLDLLAKAGLSLSYAAKEAITHCSTCSMLQKIASLNSEGMLDYELTLEQKAAQQLLDYLEITDRLPEALALIMRSKNIWHNRVFDFFKKHKKIFPSEAEKFFTDAINKNLENAGDSYYHAIADNIQQLKQVNSSLAAEYLADIRLNYKRRRNLISILTKL
ncbi:MAG: SWIM zinc finger family protein [Bacteroidales bacterium]|nr:SWIM zinc finger family protein [Bacteroidales bacterium]